MSHKGRSNTQRLMIDQLVITKYKKAGDIANKTLSYLLALCADGVSARDLCIKGDNYITTEMGKVYKRNKGMKKGIAFPCSISVNNCICHFSPANSDLDYFLNDGDLVKIDFGTHIDGYIALIAHSVVIGSKPTDGKQITGRLADVLLATNSALQGTLRLLHPGTTNYAVTDVIQQIARSYNCTPVVGMISTRMRQFGIDRQKCIIQNPTESQGVMYAKCEFDSNEVYAIDIIVSTGEGIGHERDTKPTIFEKIDGNYQLKLKTSRSLYTQVKMRYGKLPFNIRYFPDENKARMGVAECVVHRLLEPYEVLYEKPNEVVAQFKYTVMLTPRGLKIISGLPIDVKNVVSERSVTMPLFRELLLCPLHIEKVGMKRKKKVVVLPKRKRGTNC